MYTATMQGTCYGAKVTKVTKLTMVIITSSGWSTTGVAIAYPQTVKLNLLEEMTSEQTPIMYIS